MHQTYRISISPDDHRDVKRVFDFDGRSTLHDIHLALAKQFEIDESEHLYAFFMSGHYWDKDSEYVDPRTDGPRADKALLFRLRVKVGQRFVYLFDYGSEQRFTLTVDAITEVATPIAQPMLVESVGALPSEEEEEEEEGEEDEEDDSENIGDSGLDALQALAEVVLDLSLDLDDFERDGKELDQQALQASAVVVRELGEAAQAFLAAVNGDLDALLGLNRVQGYRTLLATLINLPVTLSSAGEVEPALRLARAIAFAASDDANGNVALILARAGRREEALTQIASNLTAPSNPYVAEFKAGEAYRALGEADSAEAYYRRALAEAKTAAERGEVRASLISLLIEAHREAEASALLAELKVDGAPLSTLPPNVSTKSVGRNDPCPCGSGKKYKKCHGANS